MAARVTWHGDALVAHVHGRVVAVMQECGFEIVPMVQAVTPVRTGAARASVKFEVHETTRQITLRYGGTVSYFVFLETGTRGRPGAAPLARTFHEAVALVRSRLVGLL